MYIGGCYINASMFQFAKDGQEININVNQVIKNKEVFGITNMRFLMIIHNLIITLVVLY